MRYSIFSCQVSIQEAKRTVDLWYKERQEVLQWQESQKDQALGEHCVRTLLGRYRHFPSVSHASKAQRGHIERAAINTPVQVLYFSYYQFCLQAE